MDLAGTVLVFVLVRIYATIRITSMIIIIITSIIIMIIIIIIIIIIITVSTVILPQLNHVLFAQHR